MAGMSGVAATRFKLVTASACNLPARTSGNAVGMVLNDSCTWPPTTSAVAWGAPLMDVYDIDARHGLE